MNFLKLVSILIKIIIIIIIVKIIEIILITIMIIIIIVIGLFETVLASTAYRHLLGKSMKFFNAYRLIKD